MNTQLWSPRASRVMAAVSSNFIKWEHRPSQDQMDALTEIPEVVNDILEGRREGQMLLNASCCGLGKTQLLAQCCRDILTNPEDANKSILVAIPRISEIRAFIRSVGDIGEDYAVHVNRAEKELRSRGHGYENATDARLLISTQASVRRFIKGHTRMADVDDLLFRGRIRDLRLWDEFLNTAQDIAIPITHLFALVALGQLGQDYRELAGDIMRLASETGRASYGATLTIPNFAEEYPEIDIEVLKAAAERLPGDNYEATIESLWEASGLDVIIRNSHGIANAVLTYKEYLPADFFPAVVSDASGRVRTLYNEMEKAHGLTVVRMTAAKKRYDQLEVNLWDHPGGKGQFETKRLENAKEIVAVYAKLIREVAPRGKWIVGYHGGDSWKARKYLVDVPSLLRQALADLNPVMLNHDYEPEPNWEDEKTKLDAQGLTIACLNWGRHDATSAFKLFDHVIAAGALYLTKPVLEAKIRAAGRIAANQEVTPKQLEEVERGELAHLYLQFVNRSTARVSEGGGCKPVRFWGNAASKPWTEGGVDAELFRDTFPGCRVVEWTPIVKTKTRAEEAWGILEEHFMVTSEPIMSGPSTRRWGWREGTSVRGFVSTRPSSVCAEARSRKSWSAGRASSTPSAWSTQRPTRSGQSVPMTSTSRRSRPLDQFGG